MVDKVMVFTPYGPRLEPETVTAVLSLSWSGPMTHVFQRDNPHGEPHQDILHQYQTGRDAFLAGDYDAMLVIESDIIPPPDALTKLAALDADLAYGVYSFRPAVRARRVINVFNAYPRPARNIGESLSLKPGMLGEAIQKGIVECSGAGLGCVLIKRHVLEAIDFRLEPGHNGHCDSWFTQDAWRAGYTMLADMSIVCGHKDIDGVILWPIELERFTNAR